MSQLHFNSDGNDSFIIPVTHDEFTFEYFPEEDSTDGNYSGSGSNTPSDGSQLELEQDVEDEPCRVSYSLAGTNNNLNGMLLTLLCLYPIS